MDGKLNIILITFVFQRVKHYSKKYMEGRRKRIIHSQLEIRGQFDAPAPLPPDERDARLDDVERRKMSSPL
jgi:hypothetical protein